MGPKQSQQRDKVKQGYLKIIKSKKQEYYKKNEEILNSSDFKVLSKQNWKEFIMQEIELVKAKIPNKPWPSLISELVADWNTVKDYKWRSNVLWYDYLQSYKVNTAQDPTPVTTIDLPTGSAELTNSFEAQNLIDFLHGHFQNTQEHFIAVMIAKFNEIFISHYMENGELTSFVLESPKDNLLGMCEDVKEFVLLTLQAMVHYYGGVVAKMIQDKPGEMYDLMIGEVFTDQLQICLLKGYRLVNRTNFETYLQKLQDYEMIKCADLGIHRYFQLDVDLGKGNKGYGKAVEKLREIEKQFSPLKKLSVVVQCSRTLCECVDEYWKDDVSVSKEDLVISADQILSIFLYIVFKARIPDLAGHVQMICEFGRKIIQNGSMGYYVTTLEACVEQVETMSPELLTRIREYSLKGY
jgi:hypothetical protein